MMCESDSSALKQPRGHYETPVVLGDAHAGSWVNFIFWQLHLVADMDIMLNYGNPEFEIIYFSHLSHII